MEKINLVEKFGRFTDQWSPRIIAELNGQHVKLARVEGDFIWHRHEHEDELFLVVQGRLGMELRDGTVELGPGEMLVVPRGVEHRPFAREETWIMMFEPAGTLNTGDQVTARTVEDLPWV
jgi:mannose-6-phosphate isomerase-like protein (cupin superfamily)